MSGGEALQQVEEAMSVEVLTRAVDNAQARMEMRRRGLNFATPRLARWLRKAHLIGGENIGLFQKSWDVLRTLKFVEQHVDKGAPILDVGAHTSEVLLSLHKMGFSGLTGIDLDRRVTRMPCGDAIKYVQGDLTQTGFPGETFGAITAISVVEHGFCGPKIFREVSRILKSGGYFVGSTDYWPEKVDTGGVAVYGLDWTIFSKNELLNFVEEAGKCGLLPVGQIHLDAGEAPIRWLKRKYTFAWFAFQKVSTSRGS